MRDAGLADVKVEEIDAVWEGPAGAAYLSDLRDLHRFMGPYAILGSGCTREAARGDPARRKSAGC